MKLPSKQTCEQIDRMATGSRYSFSIYRLPQTDTPILVLQKDETEDLLTHLSELNGKCGFILAPFDMESGLPIVRIRPDLVAHSWENIESAMRSFCSPQLSSCKKEPASRVTHTPSKVMQDTYAETFHKFIASLQDQTFQKLVLSRCSTHQLPPNFSPIRAFVHACNCYPRMMVSLCHTPASGTWMGSTPEIILSGHGASWHTVALAGTMKYREQAVVSWNEKNKEEQTFVSQYIRSTIKRFCQEQKENGPYTARAGQLVHLKTDFFFSLKDTAHVGDILNELHPTPAVCGLPKEKALRFIIDNEGYERKYYSGIIGWIDPKAETHLYVNLRCMHLSGNTATLYAGGGILPQSEAAPEWEETEEKMNTMQNILTT